MSDRDARFVAVYEEHLRAVYAYCRRRVSADRVEDVVAETFLAVWRKIDQLPAGDAVLPWLYGFAYRSVLHNWRSSFRRRRLTNRLAGLGSETPTPTEELLVIGYESARVLDATSTLKGEDQEVLKLSLWEELSHAEVATVLGLSVDAVRQRYSRALKKLTAEFNRLENKRSQSPAAQKGGGQ